MLQWNLFFGIAALAATASPVAAEDGFVVLGWPDGSIKQGMSRASVAAILSKRGIDFLEDGSLGPSFKDGDREYNIGFCGDQLVYASWLFPDNTQILRSLSQRVNVEGFEIRATSVDHGYNDSINSESLGLNLFLAHPSRSKTYRVIYHLYPDNGQIELRDTRYTYNCQLSQESNKPGN